MLKKKTEIPKQFVVHVTDEYNLIFGLRYCVSVLNFRLNTFVLGFRFGKTVNSQMLLHLDAALNQYPGLMTMWIQHETDGSNLLGRMLFEIQSYHNIALLQFILLK